MWTNYCKSSQTLLIKQRRACFVFRRMKCNLVRTFLYSLPPLEVLEMLILTYTRQTDDVITSWKIVKQLKNCYPFSCFLFFWSPWNLDFGKKSSYTRSKQMFFNQISLGFSAYYYISQVEICKYTFVFLKWRSKSKETCLTSFNSILPKLSGRGPLFPT